MKPETRQVVRELIKTIVSAPIPLRWRSNSPLPTVGDRRSRSRGTGGYDIAAHNKYEAGDDPRTIDWKAYGQTGGQEMTVIQTYDPRDVKIFLVVDTGVTMEFGTTRTTKRLLAAELAGSIIQSADESGDRVGVMTFSEHRLERVIPARAAKSMLFPALATIVESSELERRGHRVGTEEGSGMVKALKAAGKFSRSLIFVISDFQNLSEEERVMLKKTAVRHDLVCMVVQDLRERELPPTSGWLPSLYTFEDMRTGEKVSIWLTRRNRQKFAENAEKNTRALFEFFKGAHCDWTLISTEEGVAAHPKLMKIFAGHRR